MVFPNRLQIRDRPPVSRTRRWGADVCMLLMLLGLASSATQAQVRCMSWNVAKAIGDLAAIEDVFAAAASDNRPGFAVAPAIIALQEVTSSSRSTIETLVANGIPSASYETATYTSAGSEDSSGGAQLLLYRSDVFEEIDSGHRDIFTGAGRRADRWQLRLVGSEDPGGEIWVYGMHLKANNTSADADLRFEGAEAVRNDADGLPAGSNIIYLGDLNVYSNGEPAYQEFLSSGSGQANDPLGSGSWGGSSNAIRHTQSPRQNSSGGLVGGGLDDRFDLQLVSDALFDGEGLSLVAGTYRALGNDGNHYNVSINAGNNSYYPGETSRSNALADALFEASDHIPVLSDWRIPGRMSCVLDEDLGRVVSGGSPSINLLVADSRAAVQPSYVSTLEYEAVGDGVVIGGGDGVAPRLPSFAVEPFGLAAGLEGEFMATVLVTATSPGVSFGVQNLSTSGTAIRPCRPSWNGRKEVTSTVRGTTTASDVGVVFIDVEIHNLGWDDLQAALDLDSISGLSDGFFIWDGLGDQVTGEPGLLRFGFQTDGKSDGSYGVDLVVRVTDEDVPGETTSEIDLRLEVEIGEEGLLGDVNDDGKVNGADLGLLLGAWGACAGCPEDLNDDGLVTGADLGLLLGAWTG